MMPSIAWTNVSLHFECHQTQRSSIKLIYLVLALSMCIIYTEMSRDMTKPTKWVCAQRRLKSAWASVQSDQSLCLCSMGSYGLKLSSCGHRRLWSDWEDAQADLSLRWAYTHFVGFVMSWFKCSCLFSFPLVVMTTSRLWHFLGIFV